MLISANTFVRDCPLLPLFGFIWLSFNKVNGANVPPERDTCHDLSDSVKPIISPIPHGFLPYESSQVAHNVNMV